MTFYSELRPGALREERGADRSSLSMTQLEALKMVLGKEVAAERDLLGHYIPWLATIGSVSPLLGLLGTTIGIINAFTGIATRDRATSPPWPRVSPRRWWPPSPASRPRSRR